MQPTTTEQPTKRQLPEGLKAQVIAGHLKDIVLALGIENGRQSLQQVRDQAVARAKAANNVLAQIAGAIAFIDGTIDSLEYATAADIKRAKRQAESAKRALELAIKTAAPKS